MMMIDDEEEDDAAKGMEVYKGFMSIIVKENIKLKKICRRRPRIHIIT